MIYSLRGELAVKGPDFLVIDCGGVGYRCSATLNTLASLPAGGEVFVYTYMLVREDAVELFGFANERELECFKLLIGVSGVGPKSALSVLSDMNPDKFALAIAAGDVAQGVEKALELAGKDGVVLAFGSLFMTGPIRQLVKTDLP